MKMSPAHPEIWRSRRIGAGLALALALAQPAWGACGVAAGAADVAEVTERLEIRLQDGRLARLAGLDLPDRRRADPQTAANALAFLRDRVVGRQVGLVVFATKPDRWGRLLADLTQPGGGESVSKSLISAGFARVRPEFETRGCVAERLAAESRARDVGLGLWNDPDYSILDAADFEELAQRDGRFVIVEGIVRRVGVGRARLYLDFGARGGFTVLVARKSQSAFQSAGAPLTALAGEKIRVRGVLDDRFGPRVEVAEPLMLERLGRAEANEGTKPGG